MDRVVILDHIDTHECVHNLTNRLNIVVVHRKLVHMGIEKPYYHRKNGIEYTNGQKNHKLQRKMWIRKNGEYLLFGNLMDVDSVLFDDKTIRMWFDTV